MQGQGGSDRTKRTDLMVWARINELVLKAWRISNPSSILRAEAAQMTSLGSFPTLIVLSPEADLSLPNSKVIQKYTPISKGVRMPRTNSKVIQKDFMAWFWVMTVMEGGMTVAFVGHQIRDRIRLEDLSRCKVHRQHGIGGYRVWSMNIRRDGFVFTFPPWWIEQPKGSEIGLQFQCPPE